MAPRRQSDAADHLSKSERKLTKGASNTLSRVRFINKINPNKEVFSLNPMKKNSHDVQAHKSSGVGYHLNVKQPTAAAGGGSTLKNRSDSVQEDVSSKVTQAQVDSSRITFHSPFTKVDSTLPRILKLDELSSSRRLHQ